MTYWVIIEAGGKQRYIFATNKRRANVGASQLIYQTSDWVTGAIKECKEHEHGAPGSVEVVLLDSGTANLLVPSEQVGQCLVSAVTRKALDEAPGLEVWGCTHPVDPELGDPLPSRAAAYAALNDARGRRPSALLANPMLPITAPCRWSGWPVTEQLTDRGLSGDITQPAAPDADELDDPAPDGGAPVWVSREFAATYRAGHPGTKKAPSASRTRLTGYLPEELQRRPNKVLCRTDQDFTNWAGLMHADGDGMGALFQAIGRVGTLAFLKEMNRGVADLATTAVSAAITATEEQARERGISGPWLLPLIVGGDDVTALLDGRVAVTFAAAYCNAFDNAFESERFAGCRKILARMRASDNSVPERLTVSAGVALVKPHHPFRDAVSLAEDLCRSAKAGAGSTIDFHVLFDSVGSSLTQIRGPLDVPAPAGGRLQLWRGPYTAAACSAANCRCESISHVLSLVAAMTDPAPDRDGRPVIGGTLAHRLRSALTTGGAAVDRALAQAALRAPAAWAQMSEQVLVPPAKPGDATRTPWLDAVALADVMMGSQR